MAVAIVAGALANKPGSGGEAWVRLSWVLGLRRLGYDVYFAERLASGDRVGVQYFEQVVDQFGLAGKAGLLAEDGATLAGLGGAELAAAAADAEVLFDISGHLGDGPISASSRRRVYVDLDPGFTQLWHADPALSFDIGGYDRYVTVGLGIGKEDCLIPSGGIEWIPTLPPVVLDEWPAAPAAAEPLRFTTVATWRSPYGQVRIGDHLVNLKHHEFRRLLTLPDLVPEATFELALDIHEGDGADLEGLQEHGWRIVPPLEVAATPNTFRSYLQGSGAEFSVAQGVYVEGRTGWFSDRTAAYLASGRPALVQGTGVRDDLPVGEGMLTFGDRDEAAKGARRIAAAPTVHGEAARRIAEEHLDSDRVLGRLLERVLPLLIVLLMPLATSVAPARGASVEIAGRPQVVFDWSAEACLSGSYPDLPARAFRDFRGRIQLLLSNYVNYRLVGPSLGRLRPSCRPVMGSPEDPHPASFADRQWIASVFTRDGRTIWALIHDEYQGNRHPGRCPSRSYYRCWYNAVTLARSSDGGRTYRPVRGEPRRLVAAPSFRYRPDLGMRGVFAPSNIVRGPDRAYYALARVRDLWGRRGVCALRTPRLSSRAGWRAWDGAGFRVSLGSPYRSPGRGRIPCVVIEPEHIAEMGDSLTYNRVLGRYLLVGLAQPSPSSVGAKVRGIYYSTSADLLHWTPRTLIEPAVTKHSHRCGGPPAIAYPSVIDPTSRSRVFATSGSRPFLYYTRLRYERCRLTSDRDLLRVRLAIAP